MTGWTEFIYPVFPQIACECGGLMAWQRNPRNNMVELRCNKCCERAEVPVEDDCRKALERNTWKGPKA